MDLLNRLSAGAFGRVTGAVGDGWDTYLRFPHPAWAMSVEGRVYPVSWWEVGARRGVGFRPNSSWFEVSGYRPHADFADDWLVAEPECGRDSTGITADLKHALTVAYTGGEVLCAAWAEHTIVGTQPAVSIHGKNYVWWLDGEDSGDFPARWPHVLMDTLGRWAISLDIDSMSHYVGVLGTRAVRWPVGRERTEVSPDDRLN